jgi:hypothetical protein
MGSSWVSVVLNQAREPVSRLQSRTPSANVETYSQILAPAHQRTWQGTPSALLGAALLRNGLLGPNVRKTEKNVANPVRSLR